MLFKNSFELQLQEHSRFTAQTVHKETQLCSLSSCAIRAYFSVKYRLKLLQKCRTMIGIDLNLPVLQCTLIFDSTLSLSSLTPFFRSRGGYDDRDRGRDDRISKKPSSGGRERSRSRDRYSGSIQGTNWDSISFCTACEMHALHTITTFI